jgi:hypothetical protein
MKINLVLGRVDLYWGRLSKKIPPVTAARPAPAPLSSYLSDKFVALSPL